MVTARSVGRWVLYGLGGCLALVIALRVGLGVYLATPAGKAIGAMSRSDEGAHGRVTVPFGVAGRSVGQGGGYRGWFGSWSREWLIDELQKRVDSSWTTTVRLDRFSGLVLAQRGDGSWQSLSVPDDGASWRRAYTLAASGRGIFVMNTRSGKTWELVGGCSESESSSLVEQ